ncbi:hypothetical protein [Frigoribacterium sp. UYMn621]|uniref:hypothetical protein n=1 Tax=Frigoribacterium sp. UYMn621 TaxID=3156343 RepID=UPI00339B0A4F
MKTALTDGEDSLVGQIEGFTAATADPAREAAEITVEVLGALLNTLSQLIPAEQFLAYVDWTLFAIDHREADHV